MTEAKHIPLRGGRNFAGFFAEHTANLCLRGQLSLARIGAFLLLASGVISKPRPCRDKTTDNDVFLETTQIIFLAHDRGFGKYPCGFLERRC